MGMTVKDFFTQLDMTVNAFGIGMMSFAFTGGQAGLDQLKPAVHNLEIFHNTLVKAPDEFLDVLKLAIKGTSLEFAINEVIEDAKGTDDDTIEDMLAGEITDDMTNEEVGTVLMMKGSALLLKISQILS